MKKLLSLILALIMVVSTLTCLPLNVFAVDAEPQVQTVYAENFDNLKDGTYTAAQIEDLLGWELLRGDETAEIITVTDGVLSVDTKASATDYVFKMAENGRLQDSHTVQYDLTMVSHVDDVGSSKGFLFFAAVYTGSYDPATGVTKAVIPKLTYEGYHHMAYANGVIDEDRHDSKGFAASGAIYEQVRPESIPYDGGYYATTTKITLKNVIDVKNNQVDVYAKGGRINSTEVSAVYDEYHVSDFLGRGAYLRVQLGRIANFDNISIVTGGEAMVPNGNVVYEQNFDDVTFDPETETYQDLAAKIGWTNLQTSVGKDPTEVDEDEKPIVVPTTYSIVDGMLEILNPYGAGAVKPQIFIPEMERAKDRVVIEYDLMYLNEDILGEYDGGDQPINFTMYGRRSDFYVQWEQTQKGFNKFTFANGKRTDNKTLYGLSNGSLIQIRPQNVGYSDCIGSYKYQDQNQTHYNIYNSLDHVTVVLDKTDGVELYTNGSLTWFLTADQAEMFLATKDLYGNAAGPEHIIGHVLKLSITAGCHARLDNIKVTLDPEEIPELLITEVAATVNDKDTFEYIEVYNNSTEKVNIYEYCLINQTIVNSYKGPKQKVTSLSPAYISLMYPGSHTYKSKPDKKGISAYSLTLENPGYDDGWLEPGEVAMIWNTADAMYNGTYDTPFENMEAWDYTVEDFREAVQIGESTKVFKCYNDQNRTLENGGRYMVGLGKRSVYQPGYSPELQSGDHTIAEIPNTYENIVSYVYMLIDGGFDPYENITVSCQTTKNEEGTSAYPKFGSYCFRNNYSDLLNPKTGGPYTLTTAQFAYGLNNTSPEGLCIDFDNVETRVDATPGEVYDIQKRAFQYKVDDFKTETKYLATKVHYGIYDDTDGMKTLFAIVNGELRTEDFSEVILKDTVVKRAGANLFTANGAALDFDGTNASIRWTTTVKQTDFEALVGYMNEGVITNIEVGTLVAKTADLSDGFALKLENAAEDGKIVKIGAKTADWFLGAAEFVDAEQVKYHKMEASFNIGAEAYDTEYTAVGYISVTMKDGAVYTIYGSKSAEDQSRSVIEIAEAIRADGYQNVDDAKKTWIDSILPAIQ